MSTKPKTKRPANAEGMLSKRDVCARLNIGEKALARLVSSGQLPAYRIGAGRTSPVKFREYEVRQFVDAARVNPKAEGGRVGSPLPAAVCDNDGAHGVTRPTNQTQPATPDAPC